MGRRFVSIWLPYLATDWHGRRQPELRAQPLVLKAPVHNRMVVTAACPLAEKGGLCSGMALADARALLPSLRDRDDKPGLREQLLERIAEWCIRFTPVAAPDGTDGIVLDASGCAHLWGGEEHYLKDIVDRFNARGYTARAAMADTVGAAWALARYGKQALAERGQQRRALLPLPVSALRINTDTAERLHKLGLRRVKDILALPRPSLRRRFGEDLLKRLRQALGEEEEPFTGILPEAPWQERLPCIEPIVTRTGIEIALQRLLEMLCARLQREGKGLRTAHFRGYRIDGNVQGIEIATSRPTAQTEHLFHLFSLKLETIAPAEGIELFVIEAGSVEDRDPVQEQLWEKQAGGLEDPQLSELIDRLAGRLGATAVRRYLPAEHYWPERAFRVAAQLNEAPGATWKLDRPRPLQLLHPPERIEVAAPVPDYPPLHFRYRGQLHKIVRADGPERIEPEWWIRAGPHRDYYCVEDEQGRRYWVFREGHYEEGRMTWYLHGVFG